MSEPLSASGWTAWLESVLAPYDTHPEYSIVVGDPVPLPTLHGHVGVSVGWYAQVLGGPLDGGEVGEAPIILECGADFDLDVIAEAVDVSYRRYAASQRTERV
jgi:hypothetical protein